VIKIKRDPEIVLTFSPVPRMRSENQCTRKSDSKKGSLFETEPERKPRNVRFFLSTHYAFSPAVVPGTFLSEWEKISPAVNKSGLLKRETEEKKEKRRD
jgi:hypothetical protein